MAIASPHHVFDLAVSETEVVIEASSCSYRARFEDVDTAYFTVRLFSPEETRKSPKATSNWRSSVRETRARLFGSSATAEPAGGAETDFFW